MDVNEHDKLSNITLRHRVKAQCFYCWSTFHSQSRVFINDNNSQSKFVSCNTYRAFLFRKVTV